MEKHNKKEILREELERNRQRKVDQKRNLICEIKEGKMNEKCEIEYFCDYGLDIYKMIMIKQLYL